MRGMSPGGRSDGSQPGRVVPGEMLLDELFPLHAPPTIRGIGRAAPGKGRSHLRRMPRAPASLARAPARALSGTRPADEKAASDRSVPERPATAEPPRGRSSWHRAVVVGMSGAAAGIVTRLVLLRVLHARLVRLGTHHLPSTAELAIGGVLAMLVVIWLARRRVATSVCVVVGVALATIDLAAPVGIALVLVAVSIGRRRPLSR